MRFHSSVRPCAVCGLFYPDDPRELRDTVTGLVSDTPARSIQGVIRGVISPHAGYMYSGFTAANGYALLRGSRYDTVVVVSPSHREYFKGISVFPGESYLTPLGEVKVNVVMRDRLLASSDVVVMSDAGHREEHAIEVQLPFLQHVLGSFEFLPIVIGDQSREYCIGLGETLADILAGTNYLLVASTDLSHYHPSDVANRIDEVAVASIRQFDYEQLMSDLEAGKAEACGGGPTVAVLLALKRLGVENIMVLHHCNSGDVTGERDRVVGYVSAVAYA
jgi:AmmeMemoRadiSam system protein B